MISGTYCTACTSSAAVTVSLDHQHLINRTQPHVPTYKGLIYTSRAGALLFSTVTYLMGERDCVLRIIGVSIERQRSGEVRPSRRTSPGKCGSTGSLWIRRRTNFVLSDTFLPYRLPCGLTRKILRESRHVALLRLPRQTRLDDVFTRFSYITRFFLPSRPSLILHILSCGWGRRLGAFFLPAPTRLRLLSVGYSLYFRVYRWETR